MGRGTLGAKERSLLYGACLKSGKTHSPFCTIVIVFEWWQTITIIVPEDVYKQDHLEVIGVERRVQVTGLQDGKVPVVPFEPTALEHPPRS